MDMESRPALRAGGANVKRADLKSRHGWMLSSMGGTKMQKLTAAKPGPVVRGGSLRKAVRRIRLLPASGQANIVFAVSLRSVTQYFAYGIYWDGEGNVPKFISQEDVAPWLNAQSPSIAQVFAARLHCVPFQPLKPSLIYTALNSKVLSKPAWH
jgi:hypothetical protein